MSDAIRGQTQAIASGDTEAFATFYGERFDFVFAETRRVSGRDEAFCLDVVQEVMMRVIRSLKPVDSESSLQAWLRIVVRSCVYDRLRRESRMARRHEAIQETANHTSEQPRHGTDLHEKCAWLREELNQMDHPLTTMLMLRYRAGWTLERIGRKFGLSTGAVDGRLSRAIAAMRKRGMEKFHD